MFNYFHGTTLHDIFNYFNVKPKDRDLIAKILISEGYTTRGICYGATRSEQKLSQMRGHPSFATIFINEVRKNALKPNDPRWNNKGELNK